MCAVSLLRIVGSNFVNYSNAIIILLIVIVIIIIHFKSNFKRGYAYMADMVLCSVTTNNEYLFMYRCSLQYDNIDKEHKAIFAAIFACSKNPSSASHIEKLCKVTEDHFVDEEVTFGYVTPPVLWYFGCLIWLC